MRVARAEVVDHLRQDISGLCVGGADRETASTLIAQLRREIPNGLRLLEDPQRAVDHLLPDGGNSREVAPLAGKDLKAEFVLEQLDLLADARL